MTNAEKLNTTPGAEIVDALRDLVAATEAKLIADARLHAAYAAVRDQNLGLRLKRRSADREYWDAAECDALAVMYPDPAKSYRMPAVETLTAAAVLSTLIARPKEGRAYV